MKTQYTFIFIMIMSLNALGQRSIGLEAGAGYGTYEMTGLDNVLTELEQDLPLLTRTDDFPGYYFYDAAVLYSVRRQVYGLRYRFMSTGARSSAADYSGILSFENRVTGHQGSFFALIPLTRSDKFNVSALLESGLIWTNIKSIGTFDIQDVVIDNGSERDELGTFFELGPRFTYALTDAISLNAFINYSLDLSGVLGRGENRSNWSGLRTGISTSIRLAGLR